MDLLGKWNFTSRELPHCFQMFASNLVLSRIQGELKSIQFNCVGVNPFSVCTAI